MQESEIFRIIQPLIGKPHSEVPCWKIVDLLYGVPLGGAIEVSPEFVQVGDVVVFGKEEKSLVPDYSIGVYLGNGKIVTSFKELGVLLVPWRFVKNLFVGGLRVG